jgi:hypothetical protein
VDVALNTKMAARHGDVRQDDIVFQAPPNGDDLALEAITPSLLIALKDFYNRNGVLVHGALADEGGGFIGRRVQLTFDGVPVFWRWGHGL